MQNKAISEYQQAPCPIQSDPFDPRRSYQINCQPALVSVLEELGEMEVLPMYDLYKHSKVQAMHGAIEEGVIDQVALALALRDDQEKLRTFARELPFSDLLPIDLTKIGIVLRDSGLRDEAICLFERVAMLSMSDIPSRYEWAMLHLLEGEHLRAVELLREILSNHHCEVRSILLLSRILHAHGAHNDANDLLDKIPRTVISSSPDLYEQLRLMYSFGSYVSAFPHSYALERVRSFCESSSFLVAEQVHDCIASAIQRRVGFSLVRFGDGEGAFVRHSNCDEARFEALYQHNRADRARVWIGDQALSIPGDYLERLLTISSVFEEADIVGMPYESWIEHEYRIISVTGISALTSLLRLRPAAQTSICSQLIVHDLHDTGLIYRILSSVASVGLISCHSELPQMLKDRFQYSEIEYHYVAGEKGHSHLLSQDALSGNHWPDQHQRILLSLSRNLDGKLFLVAAGILGKFYCNEIKRFGGIAIDVGSIADGWVNARTRPGLTHLQMG